MHLSPSSLVVDSNIWAFPVAPELANPEGVQEEDLELFVDSQSWLDGGTEQEMEKDTQPGPKRRARQLTEEDLPVNDYVSVGNHTLGVLVMLLGCPGHSPRVFWLYFWGVLVVLLGCPGCPP